MHSLSCSLWWVFSKAKVFLNSRWWSASGDKLFYSAPHMNYVAHLSFSIELLIHIISGNLKLHAAGKYHDVSFRECLICFCFVFYWWSTHFKHQLVIVIQQCEVKSWSWFTLEWIILTSWNLKKSCNSGKINPTLSHFHGMPTIKQSEILVLSNFS